MMLLYKIGGLPVAYDRQLVGIITISDILRAILNALKPGEWGDETDPAPLEICQPVSP
jgi:CBS domain-containing protein